MGWFAFRGIGLTRFSHRRYHATLVEENRNNNLPIPPLAA